MIAYMKKNGLGLLLYGLLGVMLGIAGVPVTEKPVEFFLILALVMAIDITSFKQGLRA